MKEKWNQVVVATRNPHKVKELAAIFQAEWGLSVIGLEGLGVPEVVEDGNTFEANAIKKAKVASQFLQCPVIADDSGLEVDALHGAPGVLSARYAGPDAEDWENNKKLLQALKGVPKEKRGATFVCVMAFATPDGMIRTVRGTCTGWITDQPRGTHGFGYDPLFYLPELGCTMAELSPAEKNRISHRAQAVQKLIRLLKEEKVFTNPKRT